MDAERQPYFLEMNTRLQVEHPVTEMVTGVDLVKLQIRIAQGQSARPSGRRTCAQRGHAIECRVYAEDPDAGLPAEPGPHRGAARCPAGPGVRDDSGVYDGYEVPIHYDPLISKLVAYGYSREDAIRRMRRAVAEYKVVGIKTTLPFFERVLRHPAFIAGDFDTSFVEQVFAAGRPEARAGHRGGGGGRGACAPSRPSGGAPAPRPPEAGRGSSWWRAGILERLR